MLLLLFLILLFIVLFLTFAFGEILRSELRTRHQQLTTNHMTFKIEPSGDREIIMTRVFDAPRDLVFDALTKPDLAKRWLLGPPGWSMPVCEIDLKVGGTYRYVWRNTEI